MTDRSTIKDAHYAVRREAERVEQLARDNDWLIAERRRLIRQGQKLVNVLRLAEIILASVPDLRCGMGHHIKPRLKVDAAIDTLAGIRKVLSTCKLEGPGE